MELLNDFVKKLNSNLDYLYRLSHSQENPELITKIVIDIDTLLSEYRTAIENTEYPPSSELYIKRHKMNLIEFKSIYKSLLKKIE